MIIKITLINYGEKVEKYQDLKREIGKQGRIRHSSYC